MLLCRVLSSVGSGEWKRRGRSASPWGAAKPLLASNLVWPHPPAVLLPLLHRTVRPAESWAEGSGAGQGSENSRRELGVGQGFRRQCGQQPGTMTAPSAVPMPRTKMHPGPHCRAPPGLVATESSSCSAKHHLAVVEQAPLLSHPLCHLPFPRPCWIKTFS